MNKKLLVVVLVVVVGGALYLWNKAPSAPQLTIKEVIESNKKIAGDYSVAAGEKTIVKNNAKLSVDGNITINGAIECEGGVLAIDVGGSVKINNRLSCVRADEISDVGNGITIVAGGAVEFGDKAEIVTNGNVQIASTAANILDTEEKINALYDEAGKDTGTGPRIGPFIEGAKSTVGVNGRQVDLGALPFMNIANAKVPRDKDGNVINSVVIRGNWIIGEGGKAPSGVDVPTPPRKVKKILLNFDFGKNGNVEFKDFHLIGPNGRDGTSDTGKSCNARGENGEDAFRMRVDAGNIKINNFRIELGNGGKGGDAETKKDCDPGVATGGRGGEAGNFKMTASEKIEIVSMHIVPGVGGQGGNAKALGKDGVDGCPGQKGGDARATGGDGGKNKKELSAIGAVEGIGNVTIDKVEGGVGGEAVAEPGKGGSGTACKCAGGKGGDGTAMAGKGGDASLKIIGAKGDAVGGSGGDADAHGGVGGTGGNCPLKPTGGKGGNGGNAISKVGKAGKGTTTDGADGAVKDETGGNGGNGGNGCGPGNGGKGGDGKPNGNDGKPGEKQCPDDKVTPTPMTDPGRPSPQPSATPKKIKVIEYNGKYLPVEQLIVEDEIGCGTDHWHAARGVVIATDGTPIQDPGPQCGYGKTRDRPVIDIEM